MGLGRNRKNPNKAPKRGGCPTYVVLKVSRPSERLTRDRDVREREPSYASAAASLFCCSNGALEKGTMESAFQGTLHRS